MSEPSAQHLASQGHADAPVGRSHLARRLVYVLVGLCLAAVIGWATWSRITEPVWSQSVIPAGQRLTMANGLSLAAPHDAGAEMVRDTVGWRVPWLYDRGGREYDEQVSVTRRGGSAVPDVALASFRGDPLDSISVDAVTGGRGLPPLAYSSPDGAAKVYWRTGDPVVLVATALPGKQAGLIEVIGLDGFATSSGPSPVAPPTASDVNRTLKRVWRDLAIDGLPAPQLPLGT